MMMVDVGVYLAGRIAGTWEDCPCSPSEVEDLVHKVIDGLAEIGAMFILDRTDGETLDGDHGFFVADDANDWEMARALAADEDTPVEFRIRRLVCVHETYRKFPEPTTPAQTGQLPL